MGKILTIGIPTYNRKHQLIRLLKSIQAEKSTDKYSIIISDNCSNYSVEETIDTVFSGEFRNTITVKRRDVNGGGDYNISTLFENCNTSLLWLIGDDDEILPGAINRVIENHEKYPDIPVFKYATQSAMKFTEDIRMKNVNDFARCHKNGYLYGAIIFMSNNIYNIKMVKPYFSDCLYYGYCSVSHFLPLMHCLVDSEFDAMLCKDNIVKYNNPDGDHWNYLKIVTSLSTVLDINWGHNHKDIKKIFCIICSYFGITQFLLENIKITDKSYRNYTYWKGRNTVFKKGKSIFDYFALLCYWLQRITNIPFLTGFYVWIFSLQTKLKDKFREKAATNQKVKKIFDFLKLHMPIMK